MAEYYVVRDKATGQYFRGKGVNKWGKYYNQASIYRIRKNAENAVEEESWRGTQAEVVEIRIVESTADVAEVRHGEWVYHECVSSYDGAISGYSCSLCSSFVDEEIFESDDFHDEFCGHCGADMRGVEDGR